MEKLLKKLISLYTKREKLSNKIIVETNEITEKLMEKNERLLNKKNIFKVK